MPNSRMSRIGAIRANSTIPCERCMSRGGRSGLLMSVATDRHMRVANDMDRVAEHALEKARREAEAHDEDDVHVGTLVAVVGRCGGQVEARRSRITDVETRHVQRAWIRIVH